MGWEIVPFSMSNSMEAVVGVAALRFVFARMRGKRCLREVVTVVATSIVAPAVNALFGALTLKFFLSQSNREFESSLLSWWAGDAIGVLAVLPAVLSLWYYFRGAKDRPASFWRVPVLLGGVIAVGWMVFWSPWGRVTLFLLFPLLLLAAALLGAVGANSAAFFLVAVGAF